MPPQPPSQDQEAPKADSTSGQDDLVISPNGHGDDHGDDAPQRATSVVRLALLSIGICLGLFLAMIDTSIVATSLYSIGSDLGDLPNANWVALAYTLAYMGFAVVFSRVSDIIGRRDALAAAHALFVAFSLACGWCRSMGQLIAFRAVQGVGGSGLYSLAMIVLPEASPPRLRQHIGAVIGLVVAAAGVLGPVLGGLLTHYASWRWIFWINGPVGAVAFAVLFLGWPPGRKGGLCPGRHAQSQSQSQPQTHSWKQLDYPGAFLTVAAAVLVVFAFQNTGAGSHWGSAVFIAPLALGLFSWVVLFSWQYTLERRPSLSCRFSPIFPVRLFRHAMYTSGLLNTLFLGFPYLLLIYVVPLRIQVVGGKSALLAGVMLLPMLVAVAVGSILSGAVNSRRRLIAESLLAGSCLMLLGCGLLTTLSRHELDAPKLLGFIAFCGLGFGLTVSSSTMIASLEVPRKDYASAQGILAQLRILGGSLGIAASTAILRKETKTMGATPLHGVSTARAEQAAALSKGDARRIADVHAEAFHADMVVATVVSGLAVVFTLVALLQQRRRARSRQGEKRASTGDL
ncbi:hypothetical protein E4U41_004877 [Claviceps citrina]|nr:hypothetical protein E4U41_004877 [Claviceps citrina]